jgi:PKD repeat protein
MVVILILTGMVPVSRPISPTGDPLPVTKLQPDLPVGPFRVQVTIAGPYARARLGQLGVVVLQEGDGQALVLADDAQLEALARLGFEPRTSDDLGALVSAQGPEKAWLRTGLQPLLRQATTLQSLQARMTIADLSAAAAVEAARAELRAAMRALTPEQTAGIAALSSVDDDADGLTNTQEQWWCTDPMNPDSDGDGVKDGDEVAALKDWMANRRSGPPASGKPFAGWPPQIPGCRDDDQDSVPDLAERWELGLNMNRESTDRDKFDDGQELFGNTYCPGSGGYCGYGALPRNEDWGVIFAEMPSWVKAPGNHPLVAAFPVPEVDVVPSSLHVVAVTTVTTDHTISQGTERSYSTSRTEGTSTSVANTVTWNEWEEVSLTTPVMNIKTTSIRTQGLPPGLKLTGAGLTFLGSLGALALCTGPQAALCVGVGLLGLAGSTFELADAFAELHDQRQQQIGQNTKLPCNPAVQSCPGYIPYDYGARPQFPTDVRTQNVTRGATGVIYSQNPQAQSITIQPIVQAVFPEPRPMLTQTSGRSHGGAQTTTTEQYEEHTITNGEAFSSKESWGTATAVDSAHAADLWFTYKVRNTGTEYAREIANLAFNIYIGDDPNPAYTYFVGPDLGGDGKFHNFMPGEEHTYTARHIPLNLDQMKAVDLGGPIRIVVEDFTYGIDELFYQDAVNAGVLVAMEDGTDDGDEAIDTYLIPTWGTETVLDVLARYFPHTADADGNLIAIWTPEYRSDTPAWCNEPRRVGTTLWCKHALSTADWWNVYTSGLGDGSEGFQDTPAAPGSVALFRFNKDSDLDGYSDRSEQRLGTDPNDPASHPKPELIAGVHSIRSGNYVTATLSLLNTGLYDAYGVEAVMIAPDDSVSITNNTVGGSGRVRVQKQVIVGSRILLQSPLPPQWTQPGHAVPAVGGYYTGQADRTYTFTVQCGTPGGCDVGAGSWSLAWSDSAGASGTLNFGAGYASPTFRDVGTLGVKLALYTGKVYNGESFTVEARTPRDTFQYTINREPYTEPVVIVSYNDPQGNHRFITPVRLSTPTENLASYSGQMLPDPGVEIVTTAPFTVGVNTVNLVVNNPTDRTLTDAHLFLEFVNISGTVVSEVPVTVTLPPGPTVQPVTFDVSRFTPPYQADQDYIVMAFWTDYQGNILDTAARPLSSFQADPRPAFVADEGSLLWDFGTVRQGTLLKRRFSLANTGFLDLKAMLVSSGGRWDKTVDSRVPNWIDTGITVQAGEVVGIRAGGTVCYGSNGTTLCYGPNGRGGSAASGWLAPGLSELSLVARIGDGAPFLVGALAVVTADRNGRLYLGVNDCLSCYGDNGGNYQAHVEVYGLPVDGSRSLSLAPGDAQSFDLLLNTHYLPEGPFERTLTIRTSDPAHPTSTLTVRGTITAATPDTAPGSLQRPLDWAATISGSHSQGEWVEFTHTLGPDPQTLHPVKVYSQDYSTLWGVGKYATPFGQGTASYDMFGDGRDGTLTLSSGQTYFLDLTRTAVFGRGIQGQQVLPVATTSGFNIGDHVLIHQSRGTGAGTYEFNTIVAKDSGSLTLQKPLSANYRGDAFQNPNCPNGTGLRGEYFANNNWSGSPVFVRCDQWINFTWWDGGPGNGVPNDYFSVRWTGNIIIPSDGNYTFSINGDDRASLYIDGVFVATNSTVTRYLTAGTHSIRIDFAEDAGKSGVNFTPPFRDDRAQVIKIPQYQDVTVPSGSILTTSGWDGSTGGILIMRVKGVATINGTIKLDGGNGATSSSESCPEGGSGGGYRGGSGDALINDNYGQGRQGEGTAGIGTNSQNANGNGGGAGPGSPQTGNYGTGGGGGNGTPGSNSTSGGIGFGGQTAGNVELTNIVFGGGGGGSTDNPGNSIGGGGGGGGIIILIAKTTAVNGPITANGGQGGGNKWGGGGGAGGSILIRGQNVTVGSNLISAVGGAARSSGGAGGLGRIRIEYCESLSAGATNPPASTQKLNCYIAEQVESAPYTTTRLNLPESFSNGRTYQIQYGRRLVFGGAGEQVTTLRVPAGAFTSARLDALISEVGSGSLTFRLDIGNDGAWDWEWTGNVDSATTLTNTGLAAAFSRYWATHGAPLSGTVDVPVRVYLSKGGQVLLTNLQMTTTGSKVRYLRLPARSYNTVTLQFIVNNGDPNPGPLTVAADVGDDGTVDWTFTGSPAYPATLTTGNLASAVNAYLSGRSGEVDVPIRFYVAPFLALGLRDFAATPADRPDAGLTAADIAFGAATPTEGETVPVTATLHNTATLESGPLTASFFAAASGWGEWYIGSAFVPNIPAGGTAQARISWNTLGFTGTVPVRVVADPYNRLAETSETNNVATATLTIRTRPDLQVTGIALSDDEPVAGGTVTVTLTLRNNGQTTAGTQTVVLYQGNPDAGGTVVGTAGRSPIPGGGTDTVAFIWTPMAPGPYRLFARADRDNAVNEYDEGNNDAWLDVYVGLRGPILLDSGGASDVAYTPERGYGYVDEGQPDVTTGCGSQGYETLRLDPGGRVVYRFDHLLPGHFYHLDVTLYECDGAGRQESIYVDGNLIAGPEDLSDGRVHRLSLRLDPALYADRGISATVQAPGIDGAVVGEVNLHDIDYRYADAGGQADPQYPGGRWAGLGRPYGWLEGVPNTAWGTLPYQSVRVNQGGNTLRYRFDGLNPARQYQVNLTFWQPSGTARIQKVQIDGTDTGLTVNTGDYQVHRVTVDVPASAYASDGSIVVGIVRTNAATGAFVNEIALEELTAVLPPVADFTASPTEGYAPLTVQFTDRSSGAITGRSWAFGDGGSDTIPNPVHTYNNPGVYTVTLTVSGPGGSNTLTRPNYITVTSIPVTATVVSIDPSTAQANPGVPITVAVAISNVTNLGSFQFTLAYSPGLVTVQNITLGEFPGSTGRSFTPVGPNTDNNAGTATFGAFSLGATPAGPSGSGVLAYVRLLPQAGGTAALVLSGVQVANVSGQSIQVVTRNGTLFITACLGDFDGDGDVDILDVQRIAYRWNSHRGDALYEPAYDLDGDGDIDILDVQQVAYRWGTRCGQAAGLTARPTQVQTPVALSVQPYSRTVTAGQVFTVGIVVSDVVDLGGFEFTLAYSPTVVQVVSATVGTFPGSTGRTFTPLGPNVDSVAGTVSFGAFSLGATPQGASGSGTLAVLILRALAEGESGLLFCSAQVSDRSGNPQPVGDMAGGRVSVGQGYKVYLPVVMKH